MKLLAHFLILCLILCPTTNINYQPTNCTFPSYKWIHEQKRIVISLTSLDIHLQQSLCKYLLRVRKNCYNVQLWPIFDASELHDKIITNLILNDNLISISTYQPTESDIIKQTKCLHFYSEKVAISSIQAFFTLCGILLIL